jgi:hypothetical protein
MRRLRLLSLLALLGLASLACVAPPIGLTDGDAAFPDGTDAAEASPDAGETAPDADEQAMDAGEAIPDAGRPDAEETVSDAGEQPVDAGAESVDAGGESPDAGAEPADAGGPAEVPVETGAPVLACGPCPGRQACVDALCADVGQGTCASPIDMNRTRGRWRGDLSAFDDSFESAPEWCGLEGRDLVFQYRASQPGTLLVTTNLPDTAVDTILAAIPDTTCARDYIALCDDDLSPANARARLRVWVNAGWTTFFVANVRGGTGPLEVWARVEPFRQAGESCSDTDASTPFCALDSACSPALGTCQ